MSDEIERRPIRVIRRREVLARTGKRQSSLYEDMQAGTFPRPIAIGVRSVGWIEHEIDQWLERRRAKRDGAA